ncbi:MAG: hypothetical protein HQ567_24035, partial [Candidatus Nealsonbacteria bacterium]|nr:hypothetical protein [Candidatus Nealsonbacteria bacterium]
MPNDIVVETDGFGWIRDESGGQTREFSGDLSGGGTLKIDARDNLWNFTGTNTGTGILNIQGDGSADSDLGVEGVFNTNPLIDLTTAAVFNITAADVFGDSAAVTMDAASIFDVSSGLDEVIGSLTVGGTPIPDGIYDNRQAWLSGEGIITVGTVAPPVAWAGGAGNWDATKWDDGSPPLITPPADTPMIIDHDGGLSDVTVAVSFGPAFSITVGEYNAAKLTVNNGVTLGVTNDVTVGGFGTLQVDGTLDADSVISSGTLAVGGGGTLNAAVVNTTGTTTFAPGSLGTIGEVNVTAGITTMSGPAIGSVSATGGVLNTAADVADLTVDGSTVNTIGPAKAANATVSSGAVNLTGGVLEVDVMKVADGTVDTKTNYVKVNQSLAVGRLKMSVESGNFHAAGSDLLSNVDTLTLNGGTFSVGSGGLMPEGLRVWLDASTIAVADGASIETWADQSDNGNDATQGIPGDQPTYVAATGLNGQPAVHFAQDNDDNGDRMQLGDLSAQFPTGATMVAVITPDEAAWKRYNVFGNSSNDSRWCAANWNESVPGEFRTTRTGGQNYDAWPDTENAIVVLESDSAVYRLLIDGAVVNDSDAAYHNGSGFDWVIGNRVGNGQAFNGDIAEFMLFDRVLSAEDANDIGGYLADKYGLTTTYDGSLGGGVVDQATTNLTVTANTAITSTDSSVILGNLTVQSPVTTLDLQGAVYSFQDAAIAGGVTLTGEVEVRGTLDIGDGIGTLTLGSGEMALDPAATFNAQVSLAVVHSIEADKSTQLATDQIVLADEDTALQIGGTLAISSLGDRTDASYWAASPVFIDNPERGPIGDTGTLPYTGREFNAVTPAPPA